MALKIVLLASLLVAGVATPLLVEGQLGGLSSLLGLIRIQGNIFCTVNGNIGVDGTATPAFPNAEVQLKCGAGNVVSSAITNSSGGFSIVLDPAQFLLSSIVTNCNLVVNTPLSTCNPALPIRGILQSPLTLIGNILSGLLGIANIIPAGFSFIPLP